VKAPQDLFLMLRLSGMASQKTWGIFLSLGKLPKTYFNASSIWDGFSKNMGNLPQFGKAPQDLFLMLRLSGMASQKTWGIFFSLGKLPKTYFNASSIWDGFSKNVGDLP